MATSPKYPKLSISRNAPDEVKAILRKLVRDPNVDRNRGPTNSTVSVSRDAFDRISSDIGQDAIDSNSVFQILPDVELSEQILVGSIISPKDMSSVSLDFTVAEHQFESELARSLLHIVEDHFKQEHKIDESLDTMLEEILFTRGAYILATLPENNLDQIINDQTKVSMEQFSQVVRRISSGQPMGFLGHPAESNVSMESYTNSREASTIKGSIGLESKVLELPHLTVSDDFNKLKLPRVNDLRRAVKIGNLMGRHKVSMESRAKGLSPEDIDRLYNAERSTAPKPTHVLHSQEYLAQPSVGHPLVLKLPIEAVIPVYVPGEPSNHVGYFLMLDEATGRPVVKEEGKDHYGEIRSNFKANTKDNSSELVRQVKEAMGGTSGRDDVDMDQIQEVYGSIIENDLINRLRNGIYGEEFELGTTDEIYRIMLYRTFKARKTQLLYIPKELVTYMAFDYNKHGIGQTLLSQSKILSSMRSVLLFAEVMSGVRNAIGRKKTNIQIDPHDPDPEKTISDIQSAVLESSHRGFPLGSPDPAQTLDYLNRAGFDFSINVESEAYPTTRVEFDDYNTQVNAGNPELQDRLRRMHISGMGLSPDWVDPQQSPDFAVSVVNNNLLMTRRVIRYQKHFTAFLSEFISNYTRHSSKLREQLLEALTGKKEKLSPELKKLKVEEVLEVFIDSISVTLPMPDTTRIEQQLAAFEQYNSLLERALDAHVTPDLFPPEMLAQDPDILNQVFTTIRAYYQRVWLERNNIMPELDQLSELDGRKPAFSLLDIQEAHFASLGEAINRYVAGVIKRREKWERKYGEKLEEEDSDDFGSDDDADVADTDTEDDMSPGDDDAPEDDSDVDVEDETEEDADADEEDDDDDEDFDF